MEFKDKLQMLRHNNNLTQEQLANKLFVSRTAVSKWETGNGYPNLESLQAISSLFSVSINDLLSCEELFMASKENQKNTSLYYKLIINAFLDFLLPIIMCLPVFSYNNGIDIIPVNIFLVKKEIFTTIFGFSVFGISIILGIIDLIFLLKKKKVKNYFFIGLFFNVFSLALFILVQEPYASIFLLSIVLIKALVLIKDKRD